MLRKARHNTSYTVNYVNNSNCTNILQKDNLVTVKFHVCNIMKTNCNMSIAP